MRGQMTTEIFERRVYPNIFSIIIQANMFLKGVRFFFELKKF